MRWNLVILGTLLLLLACSGRDSDLPPSYRQLNVPGKTLASPAAIATGRRLFVEHCALCHGKDANGQGERHSYLSNPAQNLTDPDWQEKATPRHVYFWIREGVAGTSMPSWKSLSEDQTWKLVAYILSLGEQ